MTTTEGRIAVELEELASWDDSEGLANDEELSTRELAVYGFDSDKQTLVGLGPAERARRSRRSSEIPDSQRMPQSEPPGPFVADDDDRPRSLRGRNLRPWAFAVSTALVLAAAAVVVVHRVAPKAPSLSKAAATLVAPRPTAAAAPQLDTVSAPQLNSAPTPEPQERDGGNGPEPQHAGARLEAAPRSATVKEPVAVTAPPVKLAELPPPTVLDTSGGTDASVGIIDVMSTPPANVVLDGRPLGKAPRVVQVPTGIHTVLFIHPLYGRQSLSVNVTPGRTSNAAAEF